MNYEETLSKAIYIPHQEVHTGTIYCFENTFISPGARLDLTGSITLGEYCMVGEGARLLTHDHYHTGRRPLLLLQQEQGVKWLDKVVGKDVWFHECIVLMQVTLIPDGVVVGAGAVLTKNPDVPYGIYAGNPAVLIGTR